MHRGPRHRRHQYLLSWATGRGTKTGRRVMATLVGVAVACSSGVVVASFLETPRPEQDLNPPVAAAAEPHLPNDRVADAENSQDHPREAPAGPSLGQNAETEQSPASPENESDADSCPNGMVWISLSTDNGSGCARAEEVAEREQAKRERAERAARERAEQAEREKAEQAEREKAEQAEREKAEQAEREKAEAAEREKAEQAEREKAE